VARIGWREATNIVTQFPMPINVKEGFLTIEFPSGGSIAFKSADSPDNLRGEGLDYLIVDEADFIKAEVWEQILRPSLSDRNFHQHSQSRRRLVSSSFFERSIWGRPRYQVLAFFNL
jgi:hypothetical protein